MWMSPSGQYISTLGLGREAKVVSIANKHVFSRESNAGQEWSTNGEGVSVLFLIGT